MAPLPRVSPQRNATQRAAARKAHQLAAERQAALAGLGHPLGSSPGLGFASSPSLASTAATPVVRKLDKGKGELVYCSPSSVHTPNSPAQPIQGKAVVSPRSEAVVPPPLPVPPVAPALGLDKGEHLLVITGRLPTFCTPKVVTKRL